jgi:F420H(2)-dependent quinone reductase
MAGPLPIRSPVCLLTTKGRKSGLPRTVPLLYLKEGDDLFVVASQGGAPQHPSWYLNLEAESLAEVESVGVASRSRPDV